MYNLEPAVTEPFDKVKVGQQVVEANFVRLKEECWTVWQCSKRPKDVPIDTLDVNFQVIWRPEFEKTPQDVDLRNNHRNPFRAPISCCVPTSSCRRCSRLAFSCPRKMRPTIALGLRLSHRHDSQSMLRDLPPKSILTECYRPRIGFECNNPISLRQIVGGILPAMQTNIKDQVIVYHCCAHVRRAGAGGLTVPIKSASSSARTKYLAFP